MEGAACPVCGSLEHPAPASAHIAVPSEQERKARREALATAESLRDRALETGRESGIRVATLTSQVAALNQELEAWASAPQPVYDQALSEKQVAFNYAEAATRRADEVQRTLETSRNAEERIRSAFESADADLRHAELAQSRARQLSTSARSACLRSFETRPDWPSRDCGRTKCAAAQDCARYCAAPGERGKPTGLRSVAGGTASERTRNYQPGASLVRLRRSQKPV